jgi:hypothetical protein
MYSKPLAKFKLNSESDGQGEPGRMDICNMTMQVSLAGSRKLSVWMRPLLHLQFAFYFFNQHRIGTVLRMLSGNSPSWGFATWPKAKKHASPLRGGPFDGLRFPDTDSPIGIETPIL